MLHDANSGASRQAEHGNPLYDVLIDVPQHLRTARRGHAYYLQYVCCNSYLLRSGLKWTTHAAF